MTREVEPVDVKDITRTDDKKVTLDEIATSVEMSHGTVFAIEHEELHFIKVRRH